MDTTGHPPTCLRQHHDPDGASQTEDPVSWMCKSEITTIDWDFTEPAYPYLGNQSIPETDEVIHADSYGSCTEPAEQFWQELVEWYDASYGAYAHQPTDPPKTMATPESTSSHIVVEKIIPEDRLEHTTSSAPSLLWPPLRSVDGLPDAAFATAMPQLETPRTLASPPPTSGLVRGAKRARETDEFGAHKKQRRPTSPQAPSTHTVTPALPLTHASSASRGTKRIMDPDEALRTDERATKKSRLSAVPTVQGSVTSARIAGSSASVKTSLAPAITTIDCEHPPQLVGAGHGDVECDEPPPRTPASPSRRYAEPYNANVRKFTAILGYPKFATEFSLRFYNELCLICKEENDSTQEISAVPTVLLDSTSRPRTHVYPQPSAKEAAYPFNPNITPDIPIPIDSGDNPTPPPQDPGRHRQWQVRYLCPLLALQPLQSNLDSDTAPGSSDPNTAPERSNSANLVPCGTHISRKNDIDRHVIFQHLRPRSVCTWGKGAGEPVELGRFDSISRHMKLDRSRRPRTGISHGASASGNKENAGPPGLGETYDEGVARIAGTRADELSYFVACKDCPQDSCACWDGSALGGRRVRDCKPARHCAACKRLLRGWKLALEREYVSVQMPCFKQRATQELVGLLRGKNSPRELYGWLSKYGAVAWCTCAVCEQHARSPGGRTSKERPPPLLRVWSSVPCDPAGRPRKSQQKPRRRVQKDAAADNGHDPKVDEDQTQTTTSGVDAQALVKLTARDRRATVDNNVPGAGCAAPIVKMEDDIPTSLDQTNAAHAHEVRPSGYPLTILTDRLFLSPLDVWRELCDIHAKDPAAVAGIAEGAVKTDHDDDAEAIIDAFFNGSDEKFAKMATLPAPPSEKMTRS
ncbi:hypothetical protein C8Q80DRAFT_1272503 [Daedaleopsis nitida]|nr:hypothetical protein C8Q80DRAFT_1272503 [Daedaleopsis nitida]